MNNEELECSLSQYTNQLTLITEAIKECTNPNEMKSLLSLQNDLNELINLTRESLDTISAQETSSKKKDDENKTEIDDEYALFMEEMAKSGAYNDDNETKGECSTQADQREDSTSNDSDIEDDLTTLLGMKCAVYHTHKWGGQPTLHNAMVSAVVPRQDSDKFKDLQVHVLFTHPTHSEMLPCPFYLDGECRFDDEQCRYSHGTLVQLSDLKDAFEPDFESIKVGSRILIKLKPPDGEDISLKKKSTEKYHLWHRGVVKGIDVTDRVCVVTLEHGFRTGDKRKSAPEELRVAFENIFPLNNEALSSDSESDDSLSDTEYPESKTVKSTEEDDNRRLLIEQSLQHSGPAIGEWERHTRGIGSKLMLSMGYVPGTGLGASSDGRVQPVEARMLPVGKTLDHCMAISEKMGAQDPLKVEQRLKRMQKKEEERQKRAYEREKEKERRNVFNFLNRTIGDQPQDVSNTVVAPADIRQSTSKHLIIEQFKLTEESKRIEREINRLQSSLCRHSEGSTGHRNVKMQILEKNKELDSIRSKEQQIAKEQMQRKNKHKMTVF